MATRVLLLTQWFDPEPTLKGMVFARELLRQGFEVEVLTGFPNYPTGQVYPGYRIKLLQRELVDGVHVTRVPLYASHDHSAIRRVLNYTSFAVSALICGAFIARRADVIYAYHPPLTVGVTAGLLRLVSRTPVVYDIQDMWPDTLRATGMVRSQKVLDIVGAVCRWVYRRADHIVVLSPGFKRLLTERGVPEEKVSVIYNWADEAALNFSLGSLSPNFPPAKTFKILFAGNIGKAQALDTVLDAAALLNADSNICFILLGDGVELDRLKKRAAAEQLRRVVFLSAVPMAQVGTLLNAADALLVHLRNDPLFEVKIPSKTQAYMMVGKPQLMAVNGDAAELVRQSGGGVVAESENPEALVAAAEMLAALTPDELRCMGEKARVHYRQRLALQTGVAAFGKIFRRLASSGARS